MADPSGGSGAAARQCEVARRDRVRPAPCPLLRRLSRANLAANFASRARHGVDVGIGLPAAYGTEDLCQVGRVELLGLDRHDVGRRHIALHRPGLLRTSRSATAPAEKERYPAIHIPLAYMDMGKQHRGLEPRIAQHKMDRALVVADREP